MDTPLNHISTSSDSPIHCLPKQQSPRTRQYEQLPTPPTILTPIQSPYRKIEADQKIIAKVEKVFESIVDGLVHNSDELSISIKTRKSCGTSRPLGENGMEPVTESRKVRFPGRTTHEAWRFSTGLTTLIFHLADRKYSCTIPDLGINT